MPDTRPDLVNVWNAAVDAAMDAVNRVASLSPAARGDALLALLDVRRIVASPATGDSRPRYRDGTYDDDLLDAAVGDSRQSEGLVSVPRMLIEPFAFCDATDRREPCNQADCRACTLRALLAGNEETPH